MTLERAIKILDPDGEWRGGAPEDVEEVKEACRVACKIMRKELVNQKFRHSRRVEYEAMRAAGEAKMLEVFDPLANATEGQKP